MSDHQQSEITVPQNEEKPKKPVSDRNKICKAPDRVAIGISYGRQYSYFVHSR